MAGRFHSGKLRTGNIKYFHQHSISFVKTQGVNGKTIVFLPSRIPYEVRVSCITFVHSYSLPQLKNPNYPYPRKGYNIPPLSYG
jgi:hypothetical protein